MSQETFNRLSTMFLFQKLNEKRRAAQQSELENSLLASKLGILIAVKSDKYVNFRHPIVELNGQQLVALVEILDEYFNVNMRQEIKEMLLEPEVDKTTSKGTEKTDAAPQEKGLLNKIKRFFGKKRA